MLVFWVVKSQSMLWLPFHFPTRPFRTTKKKVPLKKCTTPMRTTSRPPLSDACLCPNLLPRLALRISAPGRMNWTKQVCWHLLTLNGFVYMFLYIGTKIYTLGGGFGRPRKYIHNIYIYGNTLFKSCLGWRGCRGGGGNCVRCRVYICHSAWAQMTSCCRLTYSMLLCLGHQQCPPEWCHMRTNGAESEVRKF